MFKGTSPNVGAIPFIMTYNTVIVNHTRCSQSDKVAYLMKSGISGVQLRNSVATLNVRSDPYNTYTVSESFPFWRSNYKTTLN